jgi:glycerol-3-phosphate dehydrogenase
MAVTIEDVLARRLGMQFYSWSDCLDAAPIVGSLMQEELQWSDAATGEAMTTYIEKIYHLIERAGLSNERHASPSSGQPAAD